MYVQQSVNLMSLNRLNSECKKELKRKIKGDDFIVNYYSYILLIAIPSPITIAITTTSDYYYDDDFVTILTRFDGTRSPWTSADVGTSCVNPILRCQP